VLNTRRADRQAVRQVVKTHEPLLSQTRLVAVYRLLVAKPMKTGVGGPAVKGTIEGVIVTNC
jgi:hypothetical protein